MNPGRRKALVVLAGMTCAAALARIGVPTEMIADERDTNLDAMFPASFGNWQVDRSIPVVLPAPDVQAKLDAIYNQVLARTYVNSKTGDRVMLSVAYGGDQSDGMQAHLPEVCYPAQGFELKSRQSGELTLDGRKVPVRRLVTRLGGRSEPVTYWLTLGETVTASRTERKLAQLRYGLKGLVADGMLIRVSSVDRDTKHGFQVQEGFLRELAVATPAQSKSRVLGTVLAGNEG